jgi:hypothetical protein
LISFIAVNSFGCDQLAEHLARPFPGGSGPEAFIFTLLKGMALSKRRWFAW